MYYAYSGSHIRTADTKSNIDKDLMLEKTSNNGRKNLFRAMIIVSELRKPIFQQYYVLQYNIYHYNDL